MKDILTIISEIISGTPIYVWSILLILIVRGMKLAKAAPLNIQKMMIVPLLFMVLGLEKLFSKFKYVNLAFLAYLAFAIVGIGIGYLIYKKGRQIYQEEGQIFRSGSYLPLIIILTNFSVKYALGILLSIRTDLYANMNFCVFYGMICGLSVGLFFGGIIQAYLNKSRLVSEITE